MSGNDRQSFRAQTRASSALHASLAVAVAGLCALASTVELWAQAPDTAPVPAPNVRPSPKKRTITDVGEYVAAREAAIAEMRGMREALARGDNPRQRAVLTFEAQARAFALAQGRGGNLTAATSATNVLNETTWSEIGPIPIPNGQTEGFVVSVSGRVTALEIDPVDTNILYLGTANGGVWRSLDGGNNWTPISDGAQSLAIGSLTLAPSNRNILYVGTGEANGSGDSFSGVGLYRIDNPSTTATLVGPINPVRTYQDGGNITQNVPAFNGRSIARILVHPTNPGIVFVGTAGGVIGMGGDAPFGGNIPPLGMRGLYRLTGADGAPGAVTVTKLAVSTGGSGFDTPNTGNRNVNDMIFPDPANPDVLVVWMNGTTAAADGGIFRSVNATAAIPAFTSVFTTTVSSARAAFAGYQQASAPTQVLYVATGESVSGTSCGDVNQSGALRRSIDGGLTWSAKLSGGGGFCGGQCFYNFGFDVRAGATAAITDDKMWLGGNTSSASCQRLSGVSTNGGSTFANSASRLHADTHFIKVDPSNANVVYHGNDGGVFKSTDGGTTWASLNATLSATEFQSLAVHPTDPAFSIGGTQDNGTVMYRPDRTWNRVDYGDGGYARIDQANTSTTTPLLYHTYFNRTNSLIGFARNTSVACASDGNWAFRGIYGGTADTTVWCDGSTDLFNGITITDAVNFYAPLELGPSVVAGGPNTVYFGSDRLYRSANRGDTMSLVSQGPIVATVPIRTVAISKNNDNHRMVGLNNGQVWATLTGSATLLNVTGNLPTPLKQVLRVMFDPGDATGRTAYVTVGGYWGDATGHVFRTADLSATPVVWTAASGSGGTAIPDVPVNCIVVDPYDSTALYACTDVGVYFSRDSGSTWNPLGAGLPRVPVFEMAFTAGTTGSRGLRIATHGRGMWEIIPPAFCVMDVDGNGVHDAATDGVIIVRAMLGLSGNAITASAIGANARRTNWTQIQPVLNLAALDIDGDGVVSPYTDGLILLRSMLGVPGTAIPVAATGSGPLTRPTWTAMRSYLNGRCSGTFAP